MPELLLGCGANRARKLSFPGMKDWQDLVTLDMNSDHNPDVVWDISKLPLPFGENTFDTVSAFEVMEHVGQQGDWKFFFAQWADIWRILKPGGLFFGTSPHWSSPWCWMDPGHVRAFGPEMMVFLSQAEYTAQVGVTPMTDYRFCYMADFDLLHSKVTKAKQYEYVLRAVKPTRVSI